ncbi:hypothetical protein SORBI_3002G348850 [Sorghum bicolor]|uniref:Uncharacterized protein n=1 Tax=Sorghum bicolor TaxID=4558 RepID=A0A1W0W727_SORBI|nr:hypothetical protein SORBI_3002G348850 [Sorghum bicolor]
MFLPGGQTPRRFASLPALFASPYFYIQIDHHTYACDGWLLCLFLAVSPPTYTCSTMNTVTHALCFVVPFEGSCTVLRLKKLYCTLLQRPERRDHESHVYYVGFSTTKWKFE